LAQARATVLPRSAAEFTIWPAMASSDVELAPLTEYGQTRSTQLAARSWAKGAVLSGLLCATFLAGAAWHARSEVATTGKDGSHIVQLAAVSYAAGYVASTTPSSSGAASTGASSYHYRPSSYSPKSYCPAAYKEDCSKKHCCGDRGFQCYEKTEYWATCRRSCTPGVDKNDTDKDKWSCKKLGVLNDFEDTTTIFCARPGDDCRLSTCCSVGSCFLKNPSWGSCSLTCPVGWDCTKLYGPV